jgi:hypothetical protein
LHVDAGDQPLVDVQLTTRLHPVSLGGIRFSDWFELVVQVDFAIRDRLVGIQPELVATDKVVQEVEALVFNEED